MTRFRGSQIRRRGAALLVTFGLCLGLFAPAVQAGPSDSTVKELSNGQPHAILIGLLLPAIQKSPGSPVNTQALDTTRGDDAAMLLPAVQKVREAAQACPSDSGNLVKEVGAVDPTGILIGMLLPAIQKLSSDSPETNPLNRPDDLLQDESDDSGLLLPAIQKVHEAAGRTERSPGPDRIERSTVSESPEFFAPTGPTGGGTTAPDVKAGAVPQGR